VHFTVFARSFVVLLSPWSSEIIEALKSITFGRFYGFCLCHFLFCFSFGSTYHCRLYFIQNSWIPLIRYLVWITKSLFVDAIWVSSRHIMNRGATRLVNNEIDTCSDVLFHYVQLYHDSVVLFFLFRWWISPCYHIAVRAGVHSRHLMLSPVNGGGFVLWIKTAPVVIVF
jgi:hypothetical protein